MATTSFTVGTGAGGVGTSYLDLKAKAILVTGEPETILLDAQLANANSPAVVQLLDLDSGANEISPTKAAATGVKNCPALASAAGVIISPPAANAVTITLKGVTGDTGVSLSLTAPSVLTFDATPAAFFLTTNGAITGLKLTWF